MKRLREDEGSSLVLVLLFVTVVALISTAFLGKGAAELRASSVLQDELSLKYGADAGLEKGFRVLQEDLTGSARRYCLTPYGPAQPLTAAPLSWGASHVAVSCQTVQGFAAASTLGSLYGAAIITTGGAGSLTTQSAASQVLDVGGTVYVSGPLGSTDLGKNINITGGDLAVAGCTGIPGAPAVGVVQPHSKYCTAVTPAQAAPPITLPGTLPVAATSTAGTDVSSTCRVFLPGTYSGVPSLLGGAGKANYFASGDYYFKDIDTWSVDANTTVVAGAYTTGDASLAGASPCSTDAAALALDATAAVSGTGATFFLGGSASIEVKGVLVMHSRARTGVVPAPVSVYAIRSTDSGPWTPWNGGTTPAVDWGSATAEMLFNGMLNTYDAPLRLFASNPSTAVARAGIVARRLDLRASASGTNLDVSGYGTSPSTGERYVRIRAVATSPDGARAVGVAVVRFDNDRVNRDVKSWRLE